MRLRIFPRHTHPMQVGDGSDGQINLAIKRGVTNGDFLQPKGEFDLYLPTNSIR